MRRLTGYRLAIVPMFIQWPPYRIQNWLSRFLLSDLLVVFVKLHVCASDHDIYSHLLSLRDTHPVYSEIMYNIDLDILIKLTVRSSHRQKVF